MKASLSSQILSEHMTAQAISKGNNVPEESELKKTPETVSVSAKGMAPINAGEEWFKSLPKTQTNPLVKLSVFEDCIITVNQVFPAGLSWG